MIHKQPAALKLLVLCCASIGLSCRYEPFTLFYTVCLIGIGIAARLSFHTIKHHGLLLLWYAVMIFLLKIIGEPLSVETAQNILRETVHFMHYFSLIVLSAAVFYETTSRAELIILCGQIEYMIRKLLFRRHTHDESRRLTVFSLTVTLTLMCIPHIFETWALLNYAYTARCGKTRTVTAVCSQAATLIPALIENVLLYAITAEKAIANRTAL